MLDQQYRRRHPYTDAAPGGWSWTDLPGGVPDADDTPGALLALRALGADDPRIRDSAIAATTWLLDLQNRDGGMPTFCRGWGRLPFDRSGADLTAHSLLAWLAWKPNLPDAVKRRIDIGAKRAIEYLLGAQLPDGAWTPLWFGNEHAPDDENRVYGTSRVLRLIRTAELGKLGGPRWIAALHHATQWLLAAQNGDGGWGGASGTPSSIEETAPGAGSPRRGGASQWRKHDCRESTAEQSRWALRRHRPRHPLAGRANRAWPAIRPVANRLLLREIVVFRKAVSADLHRPGPFRRPIRGRPANGRVPRLRWIGQMATGEAEIRMTVYLDCNATTPIDPRVHEAAGQCAEFEYGNAGSPHEFGARAKQLVHRARDQIGAVVGARRHEVIFTSGATESNNLALLGLASHGERVGKRHIVSTQIEHSSVLEPLQALADRGFEITLVPPTAGGWVEAEAVHDAVRDDTLLVSVMQVNNETGVRQPIDEIARLLEKHDVYFHVDAAQGFGKEIFPLRHQRIDLISISGHKIYAPKGIGALVLRRRNRELPPLVPLMHGGGQELGLRPGTLPVPSIVGLGMAAELALAEADERAAVCRRFKEELLDGLAPLNPEIHGDPAQTLPHTVNLSLPGLDAEEVIAAWRGLAAVSNGSACTSACDTASHVLTAMNLPEAQVEGAIRISWCHSTPPPDVPAMIDAIRQVQSSLRTTPTTTPSTRASLT